jgi:hypothetical protein
MNLASEKSCGNEKCLQKNNKQGILMRNFWVTYNNIVSSHNFFTIF